MRARPSRLPITRPARAKVFVGVEASSNYPFADLTLSRALSDRTASMGTTDADLHELFGRADKIGIDAPFGWPAPFTRAVAAYSTETVWPSTDVPCLQFRRTDEVAKEKLGRWPPSARRI